VADNPSAAGSVGPLPSCCGQPFRMSWTHGAEHGKARDQARLKERGAEKEMPVFLRLTAIALSVGGLLASAQAALAGVGEPRPWQLGLQDAATPVMVDLTWFHDFLLWIITGITIFVLALLAIVVVRFNARSNPTPSRTTHNALLEVAWTLVPVVILVAIAVPSFRLLFVELDAPKADLTVKATGKQWYWSYNYPDNGDFEFDSLIVADKDLKPDQPRLLTVDNEMVVPVNKVVHVQRRPVPWPVLRALRQGSRFHADHGPGRERRRIRRLGREREKERRPPKRPAERCCGGRYAGPLTRSSR
jgi:heme/copper-type cytochrome/quinol oxidase subunit 2